MNRHKREKLFQEYRRLPKWYYHIVFDSIEKGQLFNNDHEYAEGMNSVAVGQYVYKLSVIVFTLMVNHAHFLVYGTGESAVRFFLFMKRRINARLKLDGFPPLPDNYGFKLIKVENERQLSDTVIYIARNPLKVRPDLTAEGYIWGSANVIFSDVSKLFDKIRVKDMSYRSTMRAFHTKVRLPAEYVYNRSMGFILPESYVMNRKAEKVLRNSWAFSSGLVRNIDAYVKIAEGVGEMILLSEQELNEIISRNLKEMFNASSVSDLSIDNRCRLAVILKRKYRVDTKCIARKLQMEVSVLDNMFK